MGHVEEMLTLPRTAKQRWVYLSDESQANSAFYSQFKGSTQYYFAFLFLY